MGIEENKPANAGKADDASIIENGEPENGKLVTLSSNAIGAIRRSADAKGRAALLKELGFDSFEDARAHMSGGAAAPANTGAPNNGTAAAKPAAQAPASSGGDGAAPSNEVSELRAKLAAAEAKVSTHEGTLRKYGALTAKLRHTVQLTEARRDLAIAAVRAGAVDDDYAVRVAETHLAKLSEADAAKFNPSAFFEGLKTARPAIFSAPVSTANNAAAGGASAAAAASAAADAADARPGEPVGAKSTEGAADAKPAAAKVTPPTPGAAATAAKPAGPAALTMSEGQYRDEMAAMGLNPDALA